MNEGIQKGIDLARKHKPTTLMIVVAFLIFAAMATVVGGMIFNDMFPKAHAEEMMIPEVKKKFNVKAVAKKCLGCHRSGKMKFQNRLTTEQVKTKLIHFRGGEGEMIMVKQARPLSMENIIALAQYFGKKND